MLQTVPDTRREYNERLCFLWFYCEGVTLMLARGTRLG